MLDRRSLLLAPVGLLIPDEWKRKRPVRAATHSSSAWIVRLGGASHLIYALDFRRGEMGAPRGAFDRGTRGIRLVGTCRGQITLIGVGVPHIAGDVHVQAEQPVDIALQCAGVLTVTGGPVQWACDLRVSLAQP